jgi:hypothetical protein
MKADKGQFDEVLRQMLNKPPKKTVRSQKIVPFLCHDFEG